MHEEIKEIVGWVEFIPTLVALAIGALVVLTFLSTFLQGRAHDKGAGKSRWA